MKIRMMSAVAGVGGAMICCGECEAVYLGLGVRLHSTISIASGVDSGVKSVYRVYAVFDHVDDTVTVVGGSFANGPMTIQTFGPGGFVPGSNFYNQSSGGDGAPSSSSGVFSPEQKQWDTFATIGVASNDLNDPDDYSLSFTPGFPAFIAGNQLLNSDDFWYVAGSSVQGAAGGGGNGNVSGSFIYFGVPDGINGMGVMIAQLTVKAGDGVNGWVFVQGKVGGALAGDSYTATNQFFASGWPTPGAMGVFAAALVGGRRRRG